MSYETPTLYMVGSASSVVLGGDVVGHDQPFELDIQAQLEAEW